MAACVIAFLRILSTICSSILHANTYAISHIRYYFVPILANYLVNASEVGFTDIHTTLSQYRVSCRNMKIKVGQNKIK